MTTIDKPSFPPWLEWELLHEERKFLNPTIERKLPGTPTEIKIFRNEEYKLKGEITGKSTEFLPGAQPQQDNAGSILHSFTISGKADSDTSTYELSGCLIGGFTVQYDPIDAGFPKGTFHTELRLQRVKISQQKDIPVEWLTEWYINGIKTDVILFRSTERICQETYS